MEHMMFCPKCGTKLDEGAIFCPECGARLEEKQGETANTDNNRIQQEPVMQQIPAQKKKMGGFAVFMIFVLIALLLVGTIFFVFVWPFIQSKRAVIDSAQQAIEEFSENDYADTEDAPASVDLTDVDIDATGGGDYGISGKVQQTADGKWILTLDYSINIYACDETNENVIIKDVTSAYIDEYVIGEDIMKAAMNQENTTVEGSIYVTDNTVHIEAHELLDYMGLSITTDKLDNSNGYILPESNSKILKKSDVSDLTLQEINYAKNEIYARHGRRFDSPELQTYFNSKMWYKGTVDPDDFHDNVLSDVEKKNAEFLSKVEFSMNSKGYKLDE